MSSIYREEAINILQQSLSDLSKLDAKNDEIIEQALLLCRKAIDDGDCKAVAALAVCYEEGIGVTKNLEYAIKLYEQAIESKNSYAMYRLANICKKDNIKKALALYNEASKLDNHDAMVQLAICYNNGTGVKKDVHKYKDFMKRAYKLGNRHRACVLANMFL
jgi:TPR repeat protein